VLKVELGEGSEANCSTECSTWNIMTRMEYSGCRDSWRRIAVLDFDCGWKKPCLRGFSLKDGGRRDDVFEGKLVSYRLDQRCKVARTDVFLHRNGGVPIQFSPGAEVEGRELPHSSQEQA
jgi:hypothetical protein